MVPPALASTPGGRAAVAAIGAVVVALGLFLGMEIMISMGESQVVKTETLSGVDFIRLKREDTIEVKKRQTRKPPPPKKPPPPPKLKVKATKPKLEQLDIDMPRIDTPLAMGGGPFLGSFSARGVSGDGEAIPVVAIQPMYPRQAAIRKIEGWVKLQFTILEDGSVRNPRIIAAKPKHVFNQAALRAVVRWKFKPTVIDGKPVKDTGTYTLNFKLQD